MTDTNQKLREALQEVIAYARESGHDWLCLTEAEQALATTEPEPTGMPELPEPDHKADRWPTSHAYTSDQMCTYGEKCWKAGYKHGAWGDKPEPDMPLSMNQFGRLVELTREHLSDNTFVYKATSKTGDTCHFGVESAAKAWAKSGTVESIKVRDFKLITPTGKQPLQVEPAVNQQLTNEPVDEREEFEREMSKPPFEFCMDRWPDDGAYAWPGNYAAYHTQCAWVAWKARAAMAQGVK